MISAASVSRSVLHIAVLSVILVSTSLFTGCGGKKMIPRDVKDYMAAEFKIDRRNFDVTLPFRTTLIRRSNSVPLLTARDGQAEFIKKFFEYCTRDGVTNFQNDTLLFLYRLDSNPDINLKYYSTAYDAGEVVSGRMDVETFIDRCIKEENWSGDLG